MPAPPPRRWLGRCRGRHPEARLNATFGSAQTSTDALLATGKKHTSPESGLLTIAGSPVTADLVVFQISRDVAVDNLDADARLLKLVLFWTSNATSDD